MPKLTTDAIRNFVGDQSFQRGQSYFRDGMVVNGRTVGDTIKAECHGTRGTPYRVSAMVADGKISEAKCSCPVGFACKHIAAMLLAWLDDPQTFLAVEATRAILEKRSKAELIALIEQILVRAPEFESLIEMPMPTGEKKQQPVNPKVYQKQAAAAFSHQRYRDYDDRWGVADDIANELETIVDNADKFFEQGDPFNAAAAYMAVADEVTEHYMEFHDESGSLGGVVNDCLEGLGHCLEHISDDEQWRENILRAMFEVYRSDIEAGGIGLGDGVTDLMLEQATAAEKKQIAEWVQAAMQAQKGDEWSQNFRRQAYGGFLLELQADELDDEAYIKLCRESHRLAELLERLLQLKRIHEALKETQAMNDYELWQHADIFVRHQQGERIEQVIMARLPSTKDPRLLDWLKKRRADRNDAAGALELALKLFAERASWESYKEIGELAKQTKTWAMVRAELLQALAKKKDWALLTQIHLEENHLDEALQTVKLIQSGWGYGYYGEDLQLKVAKAAEESHPHEALDIYKARVKQCIDGRNREAYKQAAQFMLSVRKLYRQVGAEDVWRAYLLNIQTEYKSLRALKEEMANAKVG